MMQPQLQSSHQLTLFQVESQVDRYVHYTMVEQANTLARMLAKRELPMFYFAEAGEELGLTAKTCRAWKMNTWPAANRSSDDKLMYKTAIYLRVYLGLSAYSENEITRQKERQAEFQDLRVLHPESNHRETEIEPGPPTTQNVIEVRGRCRKCNAGWQSLREDGTDGWNRPVMVCMICGSENIISLDPEDPDSVDLQAPEEEEFIERYAPCRRCQAYWSHMKLERTDRWNNAVYMCLRCATVNRALPKRRKAQTF